MRNPAATLSSLRRTAFATALAVFASAPAVAGLGDPVGGEIDVNTFKPNQQRDVSVSMNAEDGDFVMAWTSYGQEAGQPGSKSGVYAQRFDASGAKVGGEIHVNQTANSFQMTPSVAMAPNGNFVVAWESTQLGQGFEVYARRYGADGLPDSGEFRVNDYTTNHQRDPDVGIDADGDFVIAYDSFGQDGDDFGVYAQRYSADGTKLAPGNFRVSKATANRQQNPSVAVEPDGDFVIAYESFTSGFKGYDIYAQRYSRFGGKIGDEILVNATITGHTTRPSAAVDAGGNFVVAYEQKDDELTQGVYAQRIASNGTKQGSEFAVNVVKAGNQVLPQVGRDALGRFTIVWTSYGQDYEDTSGVYQRRYTKDGFAFGGEKRIPTNYMLGEEFPDLAMTNDGGWIVAWTVDDGIVNSATDYEIVAQLFDGAAAPPPPDADGDGVPDSTDNCPVTPNTDQADANGNSVGDACEPPPDEDADGVPDAFDNCPAIDNADQTDTDEDNAGDACDASPLGLCDRKKVTLRGTRGPDVLQGTSRPDVILGLEGDDRIDGLEGDDTICGGGGNDTIIGGIGPDRLFGQGGNDKLFGYGGADYLDGGDGHDALNGGAGIDGCEGGGGTNSATASCESVSNVP